MINRRRDMETRIVDTDLGDSGDAEPLGFAEAMEELEGILRRIEGEETDIDALAEELQRAARLIALCRGKIRRAELEVTQIVQQLEQDEGDG
jgi:exodeoxyribonuclease VII small subunit